MDETRLGIVGVGGFGLFCLDHCRYIPGVRITAAADIKQELLTRAAEEFGVSYTTTDWRELVTHPEVDVVHIVTPPSLHAEQAIMAAHAGKHVFIEKPIAITLEDADALLRAAEENEVRVGTDFVMRYNPLYDTVRTITEEGLLGVPMRLVFENYAQDLPADHWFWNPWLSGAIPVEHGVHFFDIFASIFGPGEVKWAGRLQRAGGEEDKWLMVLQYGARMYGSYTHNFDVPTAIEQTTAEMVFERGRLLLYGWIPERLFLDALVTDREAERLQQLMPGLTMTPIPPSEQQVLANGQTFTLTQHVKADVSPGEKQAIYGRAVYDAMADFIAWTKDPQHTPRVTGADGREALRVALEVEALARKG